jgi:hypothetical protein
MIVNQMVEYAKPPDSRPTVAATGCRASGLDIISQFFHALDCSLMRRRERLTHAALRSSNRATIQGAFHRD